MREGDVLGAAAADVLLLLPSLFLSSTLMIFMGMKKNGL